MAVVEEVFDAPDSEFFDFPLLIWSVWRRVCGKPSFVLAVPCRDSLLRDGVGESKGQEIDDAGLRNVGKIATVPAGDGVPVERVGADGKIMHDGVRVMREAGWNKGWRSGEFDPRRCLGLK